jgi:hypothetical protein
MRTLNRPMFNMGGPIKQGIMHGMREPYRGGGAALVGNPVYPQTGGREHHNIVVKEAIKRAGPIFGKVGNIFKGTPTGQVPGYTPLTRLEKIKSWFGSAPAGKYLAGSPEGRLLSGGAGKAGWVGKKLWGGTKSLASSPLTVAAGGYGAYRGIKGLGGDDAADVVTGIEKPGGYPKADKKTKQAQADFAKTQRDTRVQKYLDLMGYDRAKKTAIADALIDASKIVSDRGTLDRKNITGELINPAIQALSKRLDKPDQIREAVGLMATKAAIEKDLEDPSIKALRLEQLKGLRGGFSKDIGDFILSAKGQKIKPEALKRYARAKADQHGLDFTVVTDEMIAGAGEGATEEQKIQAVVSGDGVYMIGDAIVQVTDGVPKRIS